MPGFFPQELTGKVDPAFCRAHGGIHDVGDLLVFVPFAIEVDGDLEDIRHGVNEGTDLLYRQPGGWRGMVGGGGMQCCVRGMAAEDPFFTDLSPVAVDKEVAHNGEEPGFDICAPAEGGLVGQCPADRLLVKIPGGFLIMGETVGVGS